MISCILYNLQNICSDILKLFSCNGFHGERYGFLINAESNYVISVGTSLLFSCNGFHGERYRFLTLSVTTWIRSVHRNFIQRNGALFPRYIPLYRLSLLLFYNRNFYYWMNMSMTIDQFHHRYWKFHHWIK